MSAKKQRLSELSGTDSCEPVGNASDQCYKYTIENKEITIDDFPELHLGETTQDCVFLSSASVEEGKATFVVCCRKKDKECKDCDEKFTLQVTRKKEGKVRTLAEKKVRLFCRKPPE